MDCIISFFYSFGTRFFIFLIDSIFNVIQSYDFEIPSIPSNVAVKSKIQTCGQIVQVPKNEEIERKNSLDFQVEGVVLGMVFRPDSVQGLGFRFWPGRLGQFFFKVQGTGSGFWPGRLGQIFFKKNQNDAVLVKKTKINGLQWGF